MYIHKTVCISAQNTEAGLSPETPFPPVHGILRAKEPSYPFIPLNVLRRMGKAVRLGTGAALPLFAESPNVDGIIIGTANGGMEDCIRFLDQIMKYEEGTLTPTNFVQSTPNAIAAQIAFSKNNHGYNITHVHRGLAFENAVIDAAMLLSENPLATLVLGGVDEVSAYNYNIEFLGNWYKSEPRENPDIYTSQTPGTIAGEGAAMFLVNNQKTHAIANIELIQTLHTTNISEVETAFCSFLKQVTSDQKGIDLLLTGENGDARFATLFDTISDSIPVATPIARFKHYFGETPTAGSMALWLACNLIGQSSIPAHFLKKGAISAPIKRIVLYNSYKGSQHSFLSISSPD